MQIDISRSMPIENMTSMTEVSVFVLDVGFPSKLSCSRYLRYSLVVFSDEFKVLFLL